MIRYASKSGRLLPRGKTINCSMDTLAFPKRYVACPELLGGSPVVAKFCTFRDAFNPRRLHLCIWFNCSSSGNLDMFLNRALPIYYNTCRIRGYVTKENVNTCTVKAVVNAQPTCKLFVNGRCPLKDWTPQRKHEYWRKFIQSRNPTMLRIKVLFDTIRICIYIWEISL